MKVATAFVVEAMRVEHIPAVSAIEKLSFPQPWPQNAYRREIVENRMAHYVVARRLGRDSDTSTTGASNQHAGQSGDLIGRLSRLLRPPDPPRSPQLEEELRSIVGYAGIWVMTDERRRYYSDNGEDALVMWTDALDSESFQAALDQNERKLAERLGSAEVRLGDRIWSLPNG